MDERYIVDGFTFDNMEDYGNARKEAEAVAFIKAKLDLNDTKEVIKTYGKLVQKNQVFTTPVGISFLKELRDRIVESNLISNENLKLIEIKTKVIEKSSSEAENFRNSVEEGLRKRIDYLRYKNSQLKIIICFAVLAIIILFVMTVFGKNTMINAELKVQDKYSAWEEELKAREAEIEKKEAELLKQ